MKPRRSIIAALLAAIVAAGCAQNEASDQYRPPPPPKPVGTAAQCACEPGAPVVDPVLLAFLSKARSAHHEADIAESSEDRDAAIRALEKLIAGPKPTGPAAPPEVAEVIADTRARLADLRSAGGDFDNASKDVEEGLRLAVEPTHFRGHLLELRGVVEERRAASLKEKGDSRGAEVAKQSAMKAFEEAIALQDEVILRALGDGGAPAPR